jgi:hypothetical protein
VIANPKTPSQFNKEYPEERTVERVFGFNITDTQAQQKYPKLA